ncbi:MAG: carbonic anhydrase [Bacillota bacterium]
MRIGIAVFSCVLLLGQGAFAREPEKSPADFASDAITKGDSRKGAVADKAQDAKPARPLTADEIAAMIKTRLAEIRKNRASRLADERAKAAAELSERSERAEHWSYDGENGPEKWGKLNPAWAACASGKRQSPIDIRDGIQVELEPVMFDYLPSRFSVLDNGHTVRVNVGSGSSITLTGRRYELEHFHFHRPSEEKINGRGTEMVAHLVHKDAEGRIAVVAVLIDSGAAHGLIQTVWNNLPLEKNEPLAPISTIDINQLLPQRRDYYTYMGSLTTPPCSEGVLWIVMKEPIQASPQQIAIFGRLYPMNARPVQDTSGRLIKESN